jgi:TetR/AcrR family transcriptional regulator, regulator of cefoperazone and chloramphenicol sensitivity
MVSAPVRGKDLTTRARLRQAGLELFAEHGYRGASVRAIADRAGVSAGLVVHHFGSKDGLRRAVDAWMVQEFSDALAQVPSDVPPEQLSAGVGAAVADVMGSDAHLRGYLRRSLTEDSPASAALFERFVEMAAAELAHLRAAGGLQGDADPLWAPYQLVFLIVGPLLLEPLIQRRLPDPVFDTDVIARRSAANLRLLSHGIFRP